MKKKNNNKDFFSKKNFNNIEFVDIRELRLEITDFEQQREEKQGRTKKRKKKKKKHEKLKKKKVRRVLKSRME